MVCRYKGFAEISQIKKKNEKEKQQQQLR